MSHSGLTKKELAALRSGRYSRLTEEEMLILKKAKKALLEALRAYHIAGTISHDVLEAVEDSYLFCYGASREDVDRMIVKVRDEAGEPGSHSRHEALRQAYSPSWHPRRRKR